MVPASCWSMRSCLAKRIARNQPTHQRGPQHHAVRVDGDRRPGQREPRRAGGPRPRLHPDQHLGADQRVERRRRERSRRVAPPQDQLADEGPGRHEQRDHEQQLGRNLDQDGAHGGRTAFGSVDIPPARSPSNAQRAPASAPVRARGGRPANQESSRSSPQNPARDGAGPGPGPVAAPVEDGRQHGAGRAQAAPQQLLAGVVEDARRCRPGCGRRPRSRRAAPGAMNRCSSPGSDSADTAISRDASMTISDHCFFSPSRNRSR